MTDISDNSGLQISISADTTKLVSDLNTAKASLTTFASAGTQGMQQLASASTAATGATNNVIDATNRFGMAAKTSGGSVREMRESVEALRLGLTGSGSASEIAAIALRKFASGLGGPMLLGAALSVAAIGMIVKGIMDYIQRQKEMQETATSLNLPVDKIQNYTKAMIELQQKLADVALGFSNLNEAQKGFGAATGVNMQNNPQVQDVMKPIVNSTSSETDKAKAVANAFGISLEDAVKKLQDFEDQLSKPIHSFGGLAEANRFNPSQGSVWGISPGSSGAPLPQGALTTQNQIDNTGKNVDALQSITTKVDDLKNQTAAAANDLITDPAKKILADAQLEVTKLQQALDSAKLSIDKQVKSGDLTPQQGDAAKASLTTNTNSLAASKMADANQKARELDIKDAQEYQDELTAITKAGADATVQESTDESQRIIDDAQQRVAALAQTLQKDLDNTKLTNAQKLQLEQAFAASSAAIMEQAQSKSDALRQKQNDDSTQQLEGLKQLGEAAQTKLQESDDNDKGQKLITEMESELQKLDNKYLELIQKIQDNPNLSQDQKNAQITQAGQAQTQSAVQISQSFTQMAANSSPINQMFKQWGNSTQQFQSLFAQSMNSMSSQLANFLVTGKMNFDSFATSIIADIIKITLQSEMSGIFGSGGLNLGSLFGGSGSGSGPLMEVQSSGVDMPMFAGGGTVQAGVPTMVGERGPEMFVPNTGGNIVNNSNSSGGGSPNFSVSVVNQSSTQVKAKTAKPTFTGRDAIIQVVLDDLNRGGPMSSGIGQSFGLSRSTLT